MKIKTWAFLLFFALSLVACFAQDYIVYSTAPKVTSVNKGKKTSLEKGDRLTETLMVDIPEGTELQIISLTDKNVYMLQGPKKGMIRQLIKRVNSPQSATGKFLSFLKQETTGTNSRGGHEQIAGTTFRQDSLLLILPDSTTLLQNNPIVTDSIPSEFE